MVAEVFDRKAVMRAAYFDCFAGAGGDMIAAAFIDAGLDVEKLREAIDSLGIEGLVIETGKVMRCGIGGMSFLPRCDDLQGHRNLETIEKMISAGKFSESVKTRAIAIFKSLAEVEAMIHGKDPGEIHFHEIGAVDSIVDIVSACFGLEALGVERVYCSALSVGGGTVNTAHGVLPVPAPATAELLKRAKAPTVGGPGNKELLTPTAAAILANFVDEFGFMPGMEIESIGYGAGTHDSKEFANLLRVIIGETLCVTKDGADCVGLLETNVDDATGEVVGFVMGRVMDEGGLDVFSAPIQMKANRPGVKVSVICEVKDIERMESILFDEGLTLGIRKQLLQRSKLARKMVTVQTQYGAISVKVGLKEGKAVSVKPEYKDCKEAAKRCNVELKTVQEEVMRTFRDDNSVKQ